MIEDSVIVADDLWLDDDGDVWRIARDRQRMWPIKISGVHYSPEPDDPATSVRHITSATWTRIGPERRVDRRPLSNPADERRDRPTPPRLWDVARDDTPTAQIKRDRPRRVDEQQHVAVDVHREQHLALYVNAPAGLDAHITGVHGVDSDHWGSHDDALRWHSRLHAADGFVTDHHYLSPEPAVDALAVAQPPGGVHAAQVGQTWRVDRPPIIGKVVEITRDSTGKVIRGMLLNGADTIGGVVRVYPAEDEPRYTFTLVADVEPEYEPGSMWVDADGRSWIRSVNGRWWFVGPGNDGGRVPGDSAAHTIPTRPLSLASR